MPYVAIKFFKIIKYWKNEVGFGSFAIFPNYRKDKEIFRSVGKFCLKILPNEKFELHDIMAKQQLY